MMYKFGVYKQGQRTDEWVEISAKMNYYKEQQKRDLENSKKRVAELERILGENK